jgi:hypothetical protein
MWKPKFEVQGPFKNTEGKSFWGVSNALGQDAGDYYNTEREAKKKCYELHKNY